MYESGYGVEQDIQKAIEWYTKAAGQGSEYAISRLKKLKGIQEESSGAAESPGSADSAGSTCAPWPSGSSSQSRSRFLSDSWEKIIASCRDGSYKKKYRIGDSKALDLGREVSSMDTIWIPSEKEIFFDYPDSRQGNDEKRAAYTEAFKDNTSRIRNKNNAYDLLWWAKDDRRSEGEEAFRYKRIGASWWWLRSAYRHHLSYSFLRVDSEGNIDHNNADDEGGVLIGFCL